MLGCHVPTSPSGLVESASEAAMSQCLAWPATVNAHSCALSLFRSDPICYDELLGEPRRDVGLYFVLKEEKQKVGGVREAGLRAITADSGGGGALGGGPHGR